MDFLTAVEFIASVFIIVGAGVLLGFALSSRRAVVTEAHIVRGKVDIYSEMIRTFDSLHLADKATKDYFIMHYYGALVEAPDSVVRPLNIYLQAIASDNPVTEDLATKRDQVVLAMRQDIQKDLGASTSLSTDELLSIEIKDERAGSSQVATEEVGTGSGG